MTFVYIPQKNLKSTKFKIELIQTFLNNILDSQEISQKIWNTVLFHLLKRVAFKTSGLNIIKPCFEHFKCSNVQCTNVSLRNSTCNVHSQLSKGK